MGKVKKMAFLPDSYGDVIVIDDKCGARIPVACVCAGRRVYAALTEESAPEPPTEPTPEKATEEERTKHKRSCPLRMWAYSHRFPKPECTC